MCGFQAALEAEGHTVETLLVLLHDGEKETPLLLIHTLKEAGVPGGVAAQILRALRAHVKDK